MREKERIKQTRKQGAGIMCSSLLNPEDCRPTGNVEHDHATLVYRFYLSLMYPLSLRHLSSSRTGNQAAGRPQSLLHQRVIVALFLPMSREKSRWLFKCMPADNVQEDESREQSRSNQTSHVKRVNKRFRSRCLHFLHSHLHFSFLSMSEYLSHWLRSVDSTVEPLSKIFGGFKATRINLTLPTRIVL